MPYKSLALKLKVIPIHTSGHYRFMTQTQRAELNKYIKIQEDLGWEYIGSKG